MIEIPILGVRSTLNDDPQKEGVGLTIFVSGCPHKCIKCHTPQSWDPNNGTMTSIESLKVKIKESSKLIKSVIFCGGEFLLYKEALKSLSKFCKENNLKTILYTGYKYDQIPLNISENLDIIVDGKYDETKDNNGKFPPSTNQEVWLKGTQADPNTLKINY